MSIILDTRKSYEEEDWWQDRGIMQDIFDALDSNNNYLFVKGTVGRWNGTSSGLLVIKNDAKSTFQQIFKDCDDFLFEGNSDGLLTMTGWHHDGVCTASWWTILKTEEFEKNFYIDYEGNIAKYDENDEVIYDFSLEEIDEFLVPANF